MPHTLSAGTATPHPDTDADRQPPAPESREQDVAAWVLLLLPLLQQAAMPRMRLSLSDPPEPPPQASSNPGSLAAPDAKPAVREEALARAAGAGAPRPTQTDTGSALRVTLPAGQLGVLDVTVSRHDQCLQVVIGVAEPSVKALIERQQSQLIQRLEAGGMRAQCSIIVKSPAPGTGFAIPKGGTGQVRFAGASGLLNRRAQAGRTRGGYDAPDGEEAEEQNVNLKA